METIKPEFKATLSGSLLRFALEEFLKEIDDKKTYFAVIEERISYEELTAAEVAARNLRKEMSRIDNQEINEAYTE